MSEPSEPRKGIAAENWAEFLSEFALRNNDRRARFDVFQSDGSVVEEGQELHLEDIVVKGKNDARSIEIIRIDRADANAEKNRAVVTDARRVTVQYDTDGSENALEITDKQNNLISLRLESKVDGNS